MERNKINTAVVNKKQLMIKIHASGPQEQLIRGNIKIINSHNYITQHSHRKYKELVNRLKCYHHTAHNKIKRIANPDLSHQFMKKEKTFNY